MLKATLLCSLVFFTPLLVVLGVAIAMQPEQSGAGSIEGSPIIFMATEINSEASAFVPIGTDLPDILELNVDLEGKLVVSDKEKLETLVQIQRYLQGPVRPP